MSDLLGEALAHQCHSPNKGEYCRGGFLYIADKQTALCLCNCHWSDAVTGEPFTGLPI